MVTTGVRGIRYRLCTELDELLPPLVATLGLAYVEPERIRLVASHGTRTRAYARIYGLPKPVQVGHGIPPSYTIELICENLEKADCRDVTRVIVHELLHIPTTFSGALRPHGQYVNHRVVNKLAERVPDLLAETLCKRIKRCCQQPAYSR